MSSALRGARFRLEHRWTASSVSAYLDGELGPRSRARVEGHLARCPECTRILESMGRMLRLLAAHTPAAANSHATQIAAAVRSRLHAPPAEPFKRVSGSNQA